MAWLVALLFASVFHICPTVTAEENTAASNITCENYNLYGNLEVASILGAWKARELILHLDDEGVQEYATCPIINITEVMLTENPRPVYGPSTEPGLYHATVFRTTWWREYRHLRLLWDEDGRDVEYSLYFKNDSVGFWNSHGDQNGTLPMYRNYKRFIGTVQVLKAVGDHLLLHFCQSPSDGNQAQLFSILLSREPRQLQRWEIESAHALLRRKHLSVTTRRLVCGNGGASLGGIMSIVSGLCALVYFLQRSL